MKHITNRLYELLGTLTKAEKRSFKRFVSVRYKNSTYERLFDFIYENDFPKNRVLNAAFPDVSMTRSKEYLFEVLLESLVQSSKPKQLLAKAEFLLSKSLDCEYMMEKVEAIGREQEDYAILMEVANLYRKAGRDYLPLMQYSLMNMQNVADLEGFEKKMKVLALDYFGNRKEDTKKVMEQQIQSLPNPINIRAKVAYSRNQSLYAHSMRNWRGMIDANQSIVQQLEIMPSPGEFEYLQWATALNNQLIGCFETRNFKHCNKLLLQLDEVPVISEKLAKKVEGYKLDYFLVKINLLNEYSEVDKQVDWLESQRNYDDHKSRYFLYYSSYLIYGGYFQKALGFLNESYSFTSHQVTANISKLICLFETKQYSELFDLAEKTRMHLYRNQINGFDKKFVLAIKKIAMNPDRTIEILSKIDTSESNQISTLQIKDWIKSKTSGQEILKVILEKVA